MIYQPEYVNVVVPVPFYQNAVVYNVGQNAGQPVSLNSYDSGCQVFDQLPGSENSLLNAENSELRDKVAKLTAEVEELRKQLSEKYVSPNDSTSIVKSVEWFTGVTDFWTQLGASGVRGFPQTLGFPLDPLLLSRIDGALRTGADKCDFYKLFGNYFRDEGLDGALMHYVHTTTLVDFLRDFYTSRVEEAIQGGEYAGLVDMLISMHYNADHNGGLSPGDMLNAIQRKYNHDIMTSSYTSHVEEIMRPVDFRPRDHIYGKHLIDKNVLPMIHGLTHVDSRLTGLDVAKYHVGKACRMPECAVIEVVNSSGPKYYSPIKCDGEYMICERLPDEVYGRVSVILHHGGMIPLTVVRVVDGDSSDNDPNLITGPIGPTLTALMQDYSLTEARVYFSDGGLCVHARGFMNVIPGVKCCDGAFKVTNEHNRTRKVINDRRPRYVRSNNNFGEGSSRNVNAQYQFSNHGQRW